MTVLKLRDRPTDEPGTAGQWCGGLFAAIDAERSAAGKQPWRNRDRRNGEWQEMGRATHGATRTARIGT